jgi:dynein heavy chain
MPELEKIVLDIAELKIHAHENFRLFLTSMPCTYFPVAVLQNGIKITNEPPKGVKANMMGSLANLSEKKLAGCKRIDECRRLWFSICFFHAVVQERRKFGPLGWNIRYDFNESDLETSLLITRNMLDEESEEIVWNALLFVVG